MTASDGRGGTVSDGFDITVRQPALVSNAGQAADTGILVNESASSAQQFAMGGHASGYALSEVQVYIFGGYGGSDAARVTIWSADGSGNPHESLYTLTNPSSIADSAFNTFTAPANSILLADTQHFVVVEATSGSFLIGDTTSDAEDGRSTTAPRSTGRTRVRGRRLPLRSS